MGYTPYRDDRSRGALLYVHDSITFSACDELNNSKFEASVWGTVQLNNRDSLLVGVVYKSTSSTMENQEELIKPMKSAIERKGISHIMIFGDFNFSEIDWPAFNVRGGEDTSQAKFFDGGNDMYLVQHTDFPTRFRHGQEPSTLDLILRMRST